MVARITKIKSLKDEHQFLSNQFEKFKEEAASLLRSKDEEITSLYSKLSNPGDQYSNDIARDTSQPLLDKVRQLETLNDQLASESSNQNQILLERNQEISRLTDENNSSSN